MVMVFSAGSVSGAHFNPAVSFAVFLSSQRGSRKSSQWALSLTQFCFYVLVQCMGALFAGLTYYGMTGKTVMLKPVGQYTWGSSVVCEFWYSMVLCYVVLNVATTKKQECNEYFGLAIGLTATAGLAPGESHHHVAFKYFMSYFFTPFFGAVFAYGSFYFVRKEDEFPYQDGLKLDQDR